MNKELNQFKEVNERIDKLKKEKDKKNKEIESYKLLISTKARTYNTFLSSIPIITYTALVYLLIPSQELYSDLPYGKIDPSIYPIEYILLIKYRVIFLLTTAISYLSYRVNIKNIDEVEERLSCLFMVFFYVLFTIMYFFNLNHYNVSAIYVFFLCIPIFINSIALLFGYKDVKELIKMRKKDYLKDFKDSINIVESINEGLKKENLNYISLKNEIVKDPEIMGLVLSEAKKSKSPSHVNVLVNEFYKYREELEKEREEEDKLKDAYRSVFNIDLEKTKILND
ncbi:MAG: hypothetical protein CL760_05585 [Chloroflexi bacterium]|nr:hypothetical protein [Chloroflexota bacterium]|tara:strand:+ start:14685 stop:15533 length:849 start_codon:yes stop_codon:yes gene_type:complete